MRIANWADDDVIQIIAFRLFIGSSGDFRIARNFEPLDT